MSAHWNSEHDMHAGVERRTHRPVPVPHQQNWSDQDDDALRVARGMCHGLCIGGAIWALLALGVWALSMLWSA